MVDQLTDILYELELSLLHESFADRHEKLLAPDLKEINAIGEVQKRESIIAWLKTKAAEARWDIRGFEVLSLSPELALCTYQAKQIAPRVSSSGGSMHSSLWKNNPAAGWQMVFHQTSKMTRDGSA